jgi:hypothetical protein
VIEPNFLQKFLNVTKQLKRLRLARLQTATCSGKVTKSGFLQASMQARRFYGSLCSANAFTLLANRFTSI